MAIESMVMGDAGVTALVMVGEVCGRSRRGSRSYSYVDLRRERIFESIPARTIIAGKLLIYTSNHQLNRMRNDDIISYLLLIIYPPPRRVQRFQCLDHGMCSRELKPHALSQ